MSAPLISIIGGSGFVGRHIVRQLCQAGYRIRVLCRDTVRAEFLKVSGNVGQVAIQHLDITRPDSFSGALDGSYGVIYLPGLLYQSGRQRFKKVHTESPAALAAEAARIGAKHFIFMSALGVEASQSHYAKTKLAGEQAVTSAFDGATILRPSLIIGPEDGFFQRFARMNILAPALPLIDGGKTKFQPVYVNDVAQATLACLRDASTRSDIYELTGPETYSFRQLLELMGTVTHKKVRFISLPEPLAMLMGLMCEIMPFPPQITRDQVRNLRHDNIASGNHKTLASLHIQPTHIETLLPSLLKRFR